MHRKRVLIIGANGFIGRRILDDLSRKREYDTTGCSLHDDIAQGSGHYHFVRANICNSNDVEYLFEATTPDVVINASALSVPDYCESHHKKAEELNVLAVESLARHCEAAKSRFIHLSTDFVFSGYNDTLYTEKDLPEPVNFYGMTKLEGERRIERYCTNYAIVRVAVVYGSALPGQHGNILQLVANRLRNREEIEVVSDQWRTPTFVGDVSAGIERLIFPDNILDPDAKIKSVSNSDLQDSFGEKRIGIYHICGAECLTIADIAFRVAKILGLDFSLIRPVTTIEINEATPRPRFSGMSIEKAHKELGYNPHTLDEGIRIMFDLE